MILILTGTAHGRSLAKELGRSGYRTLCCAETVREAAEFGVGQTVSGLPDRERLGRIVREYKISGVVDALPEQEGATSRLAAGLCEEQRIPCLRYAPCREEYRNDPRIVVCGDYLAAAQELNRRLGSAMLFVLPEVARLLTASVLSRTSLYLPDLKGVEVGMELALRTGVPLKNIVQADGTESCGDIVNLIRKWDIGFLVCHDDSGLPNKLEAARETGTMVLLTGKFESAWPRTAFTLEEVMEAVQEWHLTTNT